MNKKLLVLAVVAASASAVQTGLATCGQRLLSTWPPEARTHVRKGDDSGSNGRLWQTRPLVNGGPEARYTGNPGTEAYGAWGDDSQLVYVQVGQTAVSVSPWTRFDIGGMKNFEDARGQWLRENGYAGGVRTFRKSGRDPQADSRAFTALPEPRATIQIPEGARTKRGFHVDSGRAREGAVRLAALKAGGEPVRISWPMNAPAEARAISDARGGYLLPAAPATETMKVAQREP